MRKNQISTRMRSIIMWKSENNLGNNKHKIFNENTTYLSRKFYQ